MSKDVLMSISSHRHQRILVIFKFIVYCIISVSGQREKVQKLWRPKPIKTERTQFSENNVSVNFILKFIYHLYYSSNFKYDVLKRQYCIMNQYIFKIINIRKLHIYTKLYFLILVYNFILFSYNYIINQQVPNELTKRKPIDKV